MALHCDSTSTTDASERALLRGLTRVQDVTDVRHLCSQIVGEQYEQLLQSFYQSVLHAVDNIPPAVRERDAVLDEKWYCRPWYCAYVQYSAVNDQNSQGTFHSFTNMLPYLKRLGFNNLLILAHYESPMADGGYDVSDYTVRRSLGGKDQFDNFMAEAMRLGICVAADAVFNHTSIRHPWFQNAITTGQSRYLDYYVQRNGREKIAEVDRNGDIVCTYRDPDGTITDRIVVFPAIDRTHGLWVKIGGYTHQFYRTFHPFQVDLNLQNPEVIANLFHVLADDVIAGILGKRMDAVAHWIKKPGCSSEGLPETHALQALFKCFLRHISLRAILMPEVVRNMESVAKYAGTDTTINGMPCPSEGDALFGFEMQAALREATYFQTVAPFWKRVFRKPRLPKGAVWLNLLEHHDETYIGFFAPEVRQWICEYIKSRRGVVFRNGMSAGGRYADCLDNDPARIATALFMLYMSPGVPLIYSGTEIGWQNNNEHATEQMKRSHALFRELGVSVSESACYNPRELQRGPIPKAGFDNAQRIRYLPYETARKLNELRNERRSLRSTDVHPIDSGHIGVLCLSRDAEDEQPVLCVANLTPHRMEVVMPCWQVQQRLHLRSGHDSRMRPRAELRMRDLLTGNRVIALTDSTSFRFTLQKFDRAILIIDNDPRNVRSSSP